MHRHLRFLAAFGAGAAFGGLAFGLAPVPRILLAVDAFCAIYLALMLHFAFRVTAETLRAHAADADEGVPLLVVVAVAVVAASLGAVAGTLTAGAGTLAAVLALASVPLGWAMLHTVLAFHYAHLFYVRSRGDDGAGGLHFAGTRNPGPWDFLYHAFTIGMTAQVSDVVVTRPAMRRLVLMHGAVAFFYNTVILALAVNAVVSMGG